MTEKVWFASYPEEVPHTLEIPTIPIQQILTKAYEEVPNSVAVYFMGKEITYKELYESALKFANYLRSSLSLASR